MVSPKQIAKLLTEDPDVFNELTGGGVAGGAGGGWGPGPYTTPPTKRRSKKRRKQVAGEDDNEITHKKYYADPVTGQAKVKGNKEDDSGEVLYSDTKSDDPEETIDEAAIDSDRLVQLIQKADSIHLPPLDQWSEGEPMKDSLRKQITGVFRKGFGVLKQMVEELPPGCPIKDEWGSHLGYVLHLRKSDQQQTLDPFERDGNPIDTPPRGWWGQRWAAASARNYINVFFYEVCNNYLEGVLELYHRHVNSCNTPECNQRDHTKYVAQLLCSDQVKLELVWDQLRQERQSTFAEFEYWRRKRKSKPVKAPITLKDIKAYKRWMAMTPEERAETSVFDVLPSLDKSNYPKSSQSNRGVFSAGFGSPTFRRGETVTHPQYGQGRIAITPREFDLNVRVIFDEDRRKAFGQIGSDIEHNIKSRLVRKSELEIDD